MIFEEKQKEFVKVSFLRMFFQILNLRKIKESEGTGRLLKEEVTTQSELDDQSQVRDQISLLLMTL
nr:MAG TPA: hypothetical protein [Caudoviricetes sp.]